MSAPSGMRMVYIPEGMTLPTGMALVPTSSPNGVGSMAGVGSSSNTPSPLVKESKGLFGGDSDRFTSNIPDVVTSKMQYVLARNMSHSIFVSFLMLILVTVILAFSGPGGETDPILINANRTRSAALIGVVLFLGITLSIWINFIRDSEKMV